MWLLKSVTACPFTLCIYLCGCKLWPPTPHWDIQANEIFLWYVWLHTLFTMSRMGCKTTPMFLSLMFLLMQGVMPVSYNPPTPLFTHSSYFPQCDWKMFTLYCGISGSILLQLLISVIQLYCWSHNNSQSPISHVKGIWLNKQRTPENLKKKSSQKAERGCTKSETVEKT